MEELAEPLLWDEVVVGGGGGVEELSTAAQTLLPDPKETHF